MKDSYFETVELILQFRNHKDSLIRRTVIGLIPVFAVYDERKFSDHILQRAMGHLLGQLSRPSERPAAFVAIGDVAISVGSEMAPFLEPVMQQIKSGLQQRGYVL